jgi:hypothetical protein
MCVYIYGIRGVRGGDRREKENEGSLEVIDWYADRLLLEGKTRISGSYRSYL